MSIQQAPPLHAIVIVTSLQPHSADTAPPLPHLTKLTSEGCTGLLRFVSNPGAPSYHAQLLGTAYHKTVIPKTEGATRTTPFVKLKTSVIITTDDNNKDTVNIEKAAQDVEALSITKLTTTNDDDDDGSNIAQQIIASLSTTNNNNDRADVAFVFILAKDISWLDNLLSHLIPLVSSEEQGVFLSLVMQHSQQKQDTTSTNAPSSSSSSSSIVSTLKPRQSYQYSGMVPVDVDEGYISTVLYSMPGWVRRDGVRSLMEVEVVGREGGGGSVLAEHLVPEIAYKIARAPKYGA